MTASSPLPDAAPDGQSQARRAYRAAIDPTTDGSGEAFLNARASALMALCDAEFPVWVEQVGEVPEVAVISVSDAAVIAARFAMAYHEPQKRSSGDPS